MNHCQVRRTAQRVSIPNHVPFGFPLAKKEGSVFVLEFPSQTTSGFLVFKRKVWLGNLFGCPCHLTMVHAPIVVDL